MPDSARDHEPEEHEPVEDATAGEQTVPTAYVPSTGMTRSELDYANRVAEEGRRALRSIDQRTLKHIGEMSRLAAEYNRINTPALQALQEVADQQQRLADSVAQVWREAAERNAPAIQSIRSIADSLGRFDLRLKDSGIYTVIGTLSEVMRANPDLLRMSQTAAKTIAAAQRSSGALVEPSQLANITAALATMQQHLSTFSAYRTPYSSQTDADLDGANALLDAAESEERDEALSPDLLASMIEELDDTLDEDGDDDATTLPDDLEDASGASDLTPLRALYRLVVHLRPDIRDDPRLHRILRRAAGGSVVATLLVVWLLNPTLFLALTTALSVLQTKSIGARAVDVALARGEAPRSSDETPEDSSDDDEDDPQKSPESDA